MSVAEQRLRTPIDPSDDSYNHERLMGNAERLIHHAAPQNLNRDSLLLREPRIKTINEDVRINERDHGYICPRVSSLDQHRILKR